MYNFTSYSSMPVVTPCLLVPVHTWVISSCYFIMVSALVGKWISQLCYTLMWPWFTQSLSCSTWLDIWVSVTWWKEHHPFQSYALQRLPIIPFSSLLQITVKWFFHLFSDIYERKLCWHLVTGTHYTTHSLCLSSCVSVVCRFMVSRGSSCF